MTKRKTILLSAVAIVVLQLVCFGKTPTLTGKIVAYDPLLHAEKDATYKANKEQVILQTQGPKTRFIKVVFVGFGTTQIEQKYFDGTLPLTVRALRDRTCDERSPNLATQVSLGQKSGTYLLTDPFKNSPPSKIKTLECYEATEKKK